MGQLTIYLDRETDKKMAKAVKEGKSSTSKWIAGLIREKTAATWPPGIVELAGAWSDFPEAEEIRKRLGSDVKREQI